MRRRYRAAIAVVLAMPILGFGAGEKSGPPNIALSASDAVYELGPAESVRSIVPSSAGRLVVLRASTRSRIESWDSSGRRAEFGASTRRDWTVAAAGRNGRIYAVDANSRVYEVGPDSARPLFRAAPRPESFGVLSDGRVVIAAPSKGLLLHLYSADGRWLSSFGKAKTFGSANQRQNDWFNRGRVLVGPSDSIHYVLLNAPEPSVITFAPDGTLVGEHTIKSEVVRSQSVLALQYIDDLSQQAGGPGGVQVLNSAAIDPQSGRIWVLVTGGWLYELAPDGAVLNEYRIQRRQGSGRIRDIAVDDAYLYVYEAPPNSAVHRFGKGRLSEALSDVIASRTATALRVVTGSGVVHAQGCNPPCPPDHNIPECIVSCPSPQLSRSCKDTALNQISASQHKYTGGPPTFGAPECTTVGGDYCSVFTLLCDPVSCGGGQYQNQLECVPCSPCSGPGYTTNPAYCDQPPEGDPFCANCCKRFVSPILVDLSGNGAPFSNARGGVVFDVDGLGDTRRLAWPLDSRDDPWLAHDRNGNGEIDSVVELFGNMTPRPNGALADHGYQLLEDIDSNGDGWVNASDPSFALLQLWSDVNRNGISEPSELRTLPASGLVGLSVHPRSSPYVDEWGNRFMFRGRARVPGLPMHRPTWDVFVKSEAFPPI